LTTFQILRFLSSYGTAIPFLVGLFLYKKFDPTFKKVFYYALAATVFEALAKILSINYYPNTFVYSAFSVVEILLISYIFYPVLATKKTNVLYIILYTIYGIVYLWCRLFATGIFVRAYSQTLAGSFCLLFFAGFTAYKLAAQLNERLIKNSLFLFAFTVLFFNATNMFIYAASVVLTSKEFQSIYSYVWGFHSIINFLFHLFITLAMWFNSQQKR
jgi:hypothetical protein